MPILNAYRGKNKYTQMKIAVTGAAGFVGGYLLEHLMSLDDSVLALCLPGSIPETSQRVRGVEYRDVDITQAKSVSQAILDFHPDAVIHLAGISFVPEAEENFENALRINVGGTQSIYRIAHLLQSNIKVILVSSAEVYGAVQPNELPVSETTALRPANNYSLTKAMAELVASRYGRHETLQTVVMRPFNHIGPRQSNRFVASSFAYQLALIAKGKAPPVLKVGNLAARRDFSDVRDIVRAYRLATVHGQGVYNLGAGRSIPVQDVLDILLQISGLTVRIEQDPTRMRASEVPDVYADISKAERELGWSPSVAIEESLRDIYADWITRV
jgi:GDP-4-dehydro-6-deoxy-D-mannose reductase